VMNLTVGKEYLVQDTLQIRSVLRVLGTSVGTNAFGVKKIITNVVEHCYYVKLDPASAFELFRKDTYGSLQPAKLNWRMTQSEARATKEALRIELVGSIPSPEPTEETSVSTPTINNPIELLTFGHSLPFSLSELRVINSRTGATVTRFSRTPEN
jgi:hypothetical protein